MMAIGALLTIASMFMLPLAWALFGMAWWSWLAGIAAFALVLTGGARLWIWAIDNGYRW